MECTAYFDGAALVKPTYIAGFGAVLFGPDGEVIEEVAESIRRGTVSQAEYGGCLAATRSALKHGATILHLYGDSQLIVRQVTGLYATYKQELKLLRDEIKRLLGGLLEWDITWVPRAENSYADGLSKLGLAMARDDYRREPWE